MSPGKTQLHIAQGFSLPLDFVLRSAVIYGAPESGKTTTATVIAEEAWKQHIRFCAIDPKGDWYGIKSSRDGKTAGIPAIVFGGDHADLPLDPSAGRLVASIVAGLEQPVVLDLEGLSKGQQIRFISAFLEALYEHNRTPLLLILDEAQRWAPQKPISPEHTICLGAAEDITKMGRKHGIGRLFVTQRGAGFNKEVAELMDVMIAHRTPGVLDQERVQDWLRANVGKERTAEVMASLAHLKRGQAVIASGHPDMEMFATVQVRDRTTFDSSQTPAIGKRHAEPKVLAKPDLEAIKTKMADTIEKVKADDPKALKQKIRELERQLAHVPMPKIQTVEKIVEVPILSAQLLSWTTSSGIKMGQIASELAAMGRRLQEEVDIATGELKITKAKRPPSGSHGPQFVTSKTVPSVRNELSDAVHRGIHNLSLSKSVTRGTNVAAAPMPQGYDSNGTKLGAGERKVLAVLKQWPEGRSQKDLAFLTGYSAGASTIGVILSNLRKGGLVEPGQPVRLTEAGLNAAGGPQDLPSGRELLDYWFGHPKVGTGERKVLQALINEYPNAMSHDDLAQDTGYSAAASTLGVILSHLRKLGLVEKGARRVPDSFMEAING